MNDVIEAIAFTGIVLTFLLILPPLMQKITHTFVRIIYLIIHGRRKKVRKNKENQKKNNKNRLLRIVSKDRKDDKAELVRTINEMQIEFFNILGNMKLLKDDGSALKMNTLCLYIDEQYEILKKDLFDDCESERTNLIKL